MKPVERGKRLKMLSGRWTERSCGWRSQPGKGGRLLLPQEERTSERGKGEKTEQCCWVKEDVEEAKPSDHGSVKAGNQAISWECWQQGSGAGPEETRERLESTAEASVRSAKQE